MRSCITVMDHCTKTTSVAILQRKLRQLADRAAEAEEARDAVRRETPASKLDDHSYSL
jgi:hypothetical protein